MTVLDVPRAWSPVSWRLRPAEQQPAWPDPAVLDAVTAQLLRLPPLVPPTEVADLRRALADVAGGRGFLLQGGDCAERFASCTEPGVRATAGVLDRVASLLEAGSGQPVVRVGRIAGQYAKPRSSPTETVDGVELPVYRGDLVNGPEQTARARRPDPRRLLQGYHHAAATLEVLRGAVYTSHESLIPQYEEALTRYDARSGRWFATSAHLLWVGDRTRHPGGAHVEQLAGVANPVGIKVGPTTTPTDLRALCARLDPAREPGRLLLIARMGVDHVRSALPPLLRAVRAAGHPVVWVCDPMHGNTVRAANGLKTRRLGDVLGELTGFVAAHRVVGTRPGGIHLELSGADVTECVGGAGGITEERLGERYETACDPRLNPDQSLEVAAHVAALLRTA